MNQSTNCQQPHIADARLELPQGFIAFTSVVHCPTSA